MRKRFQWLVRFVMVFAFVSIACGIAFSEEFYKGKSVRIIIGFPPGGGHDAYGRLIARHLGRHIPGNPKFIVNNMPGGGALIAANYLYNVAKPDGLTLGTLMRVLLIRQMLRAPEVKFDATKFNWVGNINQEVTVCYVRAATGIKTIEDVISSKKPIPIGGTGVGSTGVDFPKLHNALLGTKFKIISGYSGTSTINMAIERGEVDGRCGYSYASMKSVNAEWIKKKFVNIILQEATRKHPDLPNVPLVMDYAKSENDRKLLRVTFATQALGRPYAFPPGTKKEHIRTFRQAFKKLYKDPKFLKEAKMMKLDVQPLTGREIDKVIDKIFSTPPNILQKLGEILK